MPFDQGRALIVGVGEYQDRRYDVPIAARDAQALRAVLVDSDVGGYPEAQVRFLESREATRDAVLAALEELAQRAGAADTVLILFTGHGALGEDGEYYLATHDARFTETDEVVAGTGLSGLELLRHARKIKAAKLLLVLNACFSGHVSGTLAPQPAARGAAPPKSLADELSAGEGRAVITASRSSQFSKFEPGAAHTYFGQALVDGLRGAAAGGKACVELYPLYVYTHERVVAATERSQEPVLSAAHVVGPFPVSLAPRGASSAALPDVDDPLRRTPFQRVGADAVAAPPLRSPVVGFSNTTVYGDVNIGDVSGRDILKPESREVTYRIRALVIEIEQLYHETRWAEIKPREKELERELRRTSSSGAVIRAGWILLAMLEVQQLASQTDETRSRDVGRLRGLREAAERAG